LTFNFYPPGMFFLLIHAKLTIMNQPERKDVAESAYQAPTPQEKTSLGGNFNSGVTSDDPSERDQIEKKGAMANIDQSGVKTDQERLEEEGRG
jgi:hypothetical protein